MWGWVKKTQLYTRLNSFGKRPYRFVLLLCLGIACPLAAQTPYRVTVSRAAGVSLNHLGVHTHANYLLFSTGSLDVLTMSRDPVHFPGLKLRAFCSLPTDHAALPPDLAAFSSPSDPPLPNPYGSISGGAGKPGWMPLPIHQNGRNCVKVLVPTRFANWLALQPPAKRRAYFQPQRYSLQVTWQ